MSWDLFVMNLPPGVKSTDDIPGDFVPSPIGPRDMVIEAVTEAAGARVDFSDPTWGRIEGPGYSIEVNLSAEDPVESFALHVRGDDVAAGLVADILERLKVGAIDLSSDSGVFDRESAVESLHRWRAFRDRALE